MKALRPLATPIIVLALITGCSSSPSVQMTDAGPSDSGVETDAGPSSLGVLDAGVGAQSWVWVWNDIPGSLNAVQAHVGSFTHVSPALYDINNAGGYLGGVPEFAGGNGDDFGGLTSLQVCSQVHSMGLKCVPLIFAGAANAGVDTGVVNILTNSTVQQSFITALVNEGLTKGYDGWNLDFETSQTVTNSQYGAAFVSMLSALRTALHSHGMILTLDTADFLVMQSLCSGGTGLVDLTQLSGNVDFVLHEAYDTPLWSGPGAAPTVCPASLASNPLTCQQDFLTDLTLLCTYVPAGIVVVGVIAPEQNGFADAALTNISGFGFSRLAVWPDSNTDGPGGTYLFMDNTGLVPSGNWYSLLSTFLQ